jgi:SAM-dependent methyltransferase
MKNSSWNNHYTKQKSKLLYPDENLVRMISSSIPEEKRSQMTAVDIGSGSGRHLKLLQDLGFYSIVGTDISFNSCQIIESLFFPAINCTTVCSPFKNNSLDLAITWGSLHYCPRNETEQQVNEIHRILKPYGFLFGTLRSDKDNFFTKIDKIDKSTYLVKTSDLEPTTVTFFSKVDIRELFKNFSSIEIGHMERTRLNEDNSIAHYFFKAVK